MQQTSAMDCSSSNVYIAESIMSACCKLEAKVSRFSSSHSNESKGMDKLASSEEDTFWVLDQGERLGEAVN